MDLRLLGDSEARLRTGTAKVSPVMPQAPSCRTILPGGVELAIGSSVLHLRSVPKMDTWTEPAVEAWSILTTPGPAFSAYTDIEFYNNTTSGSPCQVQWKLVSGRNIITPDGYTTPEQNSPHYQYVRVTDPAYWNLWYDLEWSWISSGQTGSGFVASAAIFVPAPGGNPTNGSG